MPGFFVKGLRHGINHICFAYLQKKHNLYVCEILKEKSMSKIVRFGIHGAGMVASFHIDSMMKNPKAEFVHINDRMEKSATARAKEAGLEDVKITADYRSLLSNDEVDVVVICTPNNLHRDDVIQCAEAGKAMIIEKPIAIKHEDLAPMVDAVKDNNAATHVNLELRWNPLFRTVKGMVEEGMVGEVHFSTADFLFYRPKRHGADWCMEAARAGSVFLEGGIHAVDAASWLGSAVKGRAKKIVEVKAYMGGYRKDMDYPSCSTFMCKFEDGSLGRVLVSFDAVMPYTFPIWVYGDKGTIRDNTIWAPHKFRGQTNWVNIPTVVPKMEYGLDLAFDGALANFIDCLGSGKESISSLENMVNVHEACMAARISSEENRAVSLPL